MAVGREWLRDVRPEPRDPFEDELSPVTRLAPEEYFVVVHSKARGLHRAQSLGLAQLPRSFLLLRHRVSPYPDLTGSRVPTIRLAA